MSFSARENYLFTEVRTATPQKLQVMLIDAALRSANRALQQWHEGEEEAATKSLLHAQSVLGEMLAAIDPKVGGDLSKRVAAIYEFIFRSLVTAGYRRDEKSLADAIRVLEIERETWSQLCEQVAAETPPYRADAPESRVVPPMAFDREVPHYSGGFSVEA